MLDAYRDLIDELLGTPGILRGLVGDGSTASPEIIRLIAELRDRDTAVLNRLQTMLNRADALLTPVATSADGEGAGDPTEILKEFDHARGEVVSLLMNLTLKDWARTAIDENGAEVTVADEVEKHVEFDEDHVEDIRAAAT